MRDARSAGPDGCSHAEGCCALRLFGGEVAPELNLCKAETSPCEMN